MQRCCLQMRVWQDPDDYCPVPVHPWLQVVALLYYVMSYFPGGAQGVKFMLSMFYNAVASLFGGLLKR